MSYWRSEPPSFGFVLNNRRQLAGQRLSNQLSVAWSYSRAVRGAEHSYKELKVNMELYVVPGFLDLRAPYDVC